MTARRRRRTREERRPAGDIGGGAEPARIPGWLPPVVYAAVTLFLFRRFVFSDDMLYGGDTISLGYAARLFYAEALRSGVFPDWQPMILGGIPFLEALAAGDSLYPTSLLLLVLEPYRALGWKLVVHVFAAGLFMFGWTRSLGRSRAASLVAGLAYLVGPFLVTLVYPGHDGKLFVTALAPLLFWAMEWTFVRRGLLPYAAVAATVALVIFTTHFQLAFFLFGAAGAYYAFRCVQLWRGTGAGAAARGSGARNDGPSEADRADVDPGVDGGGGGDGSPAEATSRRRARPALGRFALFLAASILGAAIAAVQLVPAVEYVTEDSRRTATTTRATEEANRAYASSWSLHPEEAFGLLVPEFAGNDAAGGGWTGGTYWGRNPTRNNSPYAGLVVLLLAVAGFFGGARRGVRLFFAVLGAVAVLYALGAHTPVWRLFYALLPPVRLFRAPDMVTFLFGFSAATLASFGVDRLLELARGGAGEDGAPLARMGRALWIAVGVMGGLLLLAASGALFDLWTSTIYADIHPVRARTLEAYQGSLAGAFFLALLLAAAVAGVAWAARRGFLEPVAVTALLAILVGFDGVRIDDRFIRTFEFEAFGAPDDNMRYLMERKREEPPFRVVSTHQNMQDVRPAQFGLELATGHHPNDLARYRELLGMEGSDAARNIQDPHVYTILNVRYLVVPGEAEGLPVVSRVTAPDGRVVESVLRAPGFDRARLVGRYEVVPDDRAVARLMEDDFDPATTAILAEEPPIALDPDGGDPVGEVTWEERNSERLRLRVTSDRPALLVLSENWYPAWHATVDGRETPVLRAYHALRAVAIPAGSHVVELDYRSSTLRLGLWISVVAAALVAAAAVASVLAGRRRRDGPREA